MILNARIYRPLLHPRNKILFLVLFWVGLYAWSTLTWTGLVTVDRAYRKTESRFNNSFLGYTQLADATTRDQSQLELIVDQQVMTLVAFPTGERMGTAPDGTSYAEVPQAKAEKVLVLHETSQGGDAPQFTWNLRVDQPDNGTYLIQFFAKESGTYTIHASLTGIEGMYSQRFELHIPLAAHEPLKYELKFHKETVHRTQFQQARWWSRL